MAEAETAERSKDMHALLISYLGFILQIVGFNE